MPTPLGEKIRTLRKKKGYTLDKLAETGRIEQKLHLGTGEQGPAAALRRQDREDRHRPRSHARLPHHQFGAGRRRDRHGVLPQVPARWHPATKDKIRRMMDLIGDDE